MGAWLLTFIQKLGARFVIKQSLSTMWRIDKVRFIEAQILTRDAIGVIAIFNAINAAKISVLESQNSFHSTSRNIQFSDPKEPK